MCKLGVAVVVGWLETVRFASLVVKQLEARVVIRILGCYWAVGFPVTVTEGSC